MEGSKAVGEEDAWGYGKAAATADLREGQRTPSRALLNSSKQVQLASGKTDPEDTVVDNSAEAAAGDSWAENVQKNDGRLEESKLSKQLNLVRMEDGLLMGYDGDQEEVELGEHNALRTEHKSQGVKAQPRKTVKERQKQSKSKHVYEVMQQTGGWAGKWSLRSMKKVARQRQTVETKNNREEKTEAKDREQRDRLMESKEIAGQSLSDSNLQNMARLAGKTQIEVQRGVEDSIFLEAESIRQIGSVVGFHMEAAKEQIVEQLKGTRTGKGTKLNL